jgi:hypothetical protein
MPKHLNKLIFEKDKINEGSGSFSIQSLHE